MGNLCHTHLEISGIEADVTAMVALMTTKPFHPRHQFDLQAILPIPESIADNEVGNWCRENWGTTHPCIADTLWQRTAGYAAIDFFTNGSEPLYALEALSRRFPKLRFLVEIYGIETIPDLYMITNGESPEVGRVQGRPVSVDPQGFTAWMERNGYLLNPETGHVFHDPKWLDKPSPDALVSTAERMKAVRNGLALDAS